MQVHAIINMYAYKGLHDSAWICVLSMALFNLKKHHHDGFQLIEK